MTGTPPQRHPGLQPAQPLGAGRRPAVAAPLVEQQGRWQVGQKRPPSSGL